MKFNPNIHNRRSIRLKDYDYSRGGEYFVTICTNKRERIFGEVVNEEIILSQIGSIVKCCWKKIPEYYQNVELDRFVVMPNHIHGIVIIKNPVGAIHELPLQMTQQNRRNMLLPKIIGRFKMISAKEINSFRKTIGYCLWQRNYYDRIIRNEKELKNIRDYILDNPLNWVFDEEY